MDLLPKTHTEFTSTAYWDSFFKKRGGEAFEWYGEYIDHCDQIHKYVKPVDTILMVGCGNSNLSMDMYDAGFRNITNIDISTVAIENMKRINAKKRPDMKFLEMDATAMTFEDESFSVIIDKGTLDALFVDNTKEVREQVTKYLKEMHRVLKNNGRFLCFSLLQEHILEYVCEFFPKLEYITRIITLDDHLGQDENSPSLPVFLLANHKFKINLKNLKMETCEFYTRRDVDSKEIVRTGPAGLKDSVNCVQRTAMVLSGLSHGNIAGHNEVNIELYRDGNRDAPGYQVYILDHPPARDWGKYAVFIVPQGRELEWLFGTPEGRRKLQEQCKFQRLAIVTFQPHPQAKYNSLEEVKKELTNSIQVLAPKGYKGQIPFLSCGNDIGKREIIYEGNSDLSGKFWIEDVCRNEKEKTELRRLIFKSNQAVIQSEALLKPNKKGKKIIDYGYLACDHHIFMSVGVQMAASLTDKQSSNVLLIGLGGGSLCNFLHQALNNVHITAIEIDAEIFKVAKEYFGLITNQRINVVIEDGLSYIERCKKENMHFDSILFDVDNKDYKTGLSCPPESFLASNVLENVKSLIGSKGLFILNLVARNNKIREEVIKDLKKTFSSICCYKLTEDVNEIIFCSNDQSYKNLDNWKEIMENAAKNLNLAVRTRKLINVKDNDIVDVKDFLKDLKL